MKKFLRKITKRLYFKNMITVNFDDIRDSTTEAEIGCHGFIEYISSPLIL